MSKAITVICDFCGTRGLLRQGVGLEYGEKWDAWEYPEGWMGVVTSSRLLSSSAISVDTLKHACPTCAPKMKDEALPPVGACTDD